METLWFVCLVLFSAQRASTRTPTPGLSCVNDYINKIDCVWNSSEIAPNDHCKIHTSMNTERGLENKTCDLEVLDRLGRSLRACSVVVNIEFYALSKLSIRVECAGSLLDELTDYRPLNYIKMHPPGVPIINTSANGTLVSWSPGDPLSELVWRYTFQVQVKRGQQRWEEGHSVTRTHQDPSMLMEEVETAGVYQVRVRVRADKAKGSVWSAWSPVSSWEESGRTEATPPDLPPQDRVRMLALGAVAAAALVSVVLLVLCSACADKRKKHQHVPDPSRYFHALNSVHGGNFQKWTSPLFAQESFLKAPPSEDISPLEVSDAAVPFAPAPAAVTPALFHGGPGTPATHGWAGGGDSSGQSSSSSFFANIGYFLSDRPISVHDSRPVYFTYQEDHLHALRWPSHGSDSYERLLWPGTTCVSHQREPQSPDSGFSGGSQDPTEEAEESEKDVSHPPSLLILPLSMPPTGTPPRPRNLPPVPPPNSQLDSVPPPGGSYNAWPVEGALGRSSSMRMEPSGVGYLTIKELQTTYSNKSI